MRPLLGGKELSVLLDALMDKSDEFRVQREQAESLAIRAKPFSPEAKAQFVETVTEAFEQSRVVAPLLGTSHTTPDARPVHVRLRVSVFRHSFVANGGPVAGIETVGQEFAAFEDYRLLRMITDFARSDLGHSDLSPRDIFEMRLMLEEIYEGPACIACPVGGGLYEALEHSPDFRPWYREAIAEPPAYSGRLGEVTLYVTHGLKPEEAVSFIQGQIGDLAVTGPLQVSDPVDLLYDAANATKAAVSVELSEELLVALNPHGMPRVWDLSEWISTEEPEA